MTMEANCFVKLYAILMQKICVYVNEVIKLFRCTGCLVIVEYVLDYCIVYIHVLKPERSM